VELEDQSILYLDQGRLQTTVPNRSNVPISFVYDGKHSSDVLPGWKYSESTRRAGPHIQRVVAYQDPDTGFLIECEVTTYADRAGIDWVCWLSNTGREQTPLIDQFLPLDVERLATSAVAEDPPLLRWSNGDGCTAESFLPHDETLEPGASRQFQARSSDTSCFPFFNLHVSSGGWILAVGWSGTWAVEFERGNQGDLADRAGMPRTHFRLRPGERVRTPRILLCPYTGGSLIDGHNQVRQLMLQHYLPWRDGRPAEPPVASNGTAGLYVRAQRDRRPLGRLNEQVELAAVEQIARLGCEAYWLDAYWYPQPWHENLGNWFPRPEDFPRGLRPLSDAAHRRGLQFVLWFAPYYVRPGTQWAREYPQHIHGAGRQVDGVLKLGEPAARQFVTDWLSDRIEEWQVDIYREDLGIGQPPEEGEDRLGVAEMKHVEGFYEIWSELLRRHPQLLIDNCCGGGRRIDLETSRRAFTLWRSDFNDIGEGLKGREHWPRMGTADQVMVSGLSLYVPFHTGPVWDVRPYCFRSAMSSGIVLYNDLQDPQFAGEMARHAIVELKRLRPLFQGDIYPLLPLTSRQDDWYAYQLDHPRLRRGCVLVFRRPEALDDSHVLTLRNLDPSATYRVEVRGESYGEPATRQVGGSELQQLRVDIPSRPASALIEYCLAEQ
jgi:alpha-galactosidase